MRAFRGPLDIVWFHRVIRITTVHRHWVTICIALGPDLPIAIANLDLQWLIGIFGGPAATQ